MTTTTTAQPAPASILIADDNEIVRQVLRQLLENLYRELPAAEGLVIRTAENGREAVSLAFDELPDLILMDVQMPVLDGIDAFYELKALRGGTPAKTYFVTGCPNDGRTGRRIQEAIDDGALGHACKPIALQELARIVRRHVLENGAPGAERHSRRGVPLGAGVPSVTRKATTVLKHMSAR